MSGLKNESLSPSLQKKISMFKKRIWIDSKKNNMSASFSLTVHENQRMFKKIVNLSNIYIELPMGYTEPYYYIKVVCTNAEKDESFSIAHGDTSTNRMYPVYVDDKETPIEIPVFFEIDTMITMEFYDTDFAKIMIGRFCGLAVITSNPMYAK